MWKQLKRVTIPMFYGDKRNYQNWKAAFVACVDQAPATAEYKLLSCRRGTESDRESGSFCSSISGCNGELERKFGGQRCQVALYLEEIDSFKPVSLGSSKDIEKFADHLCFKNLNSHI